MYDFPLTGAQKTFLRGLGQRLDPVLKLGKGGLTPTFYAELQKQLRAHELVKLRFLAAEAEALDRQFELHVYASLCARGKKAAAQEFLQTSPIRTAFPELLTRLADKRPREEKN